jgi:3',5'-cyclic AMP phosphodiesterase CpdA
VGLNPSKYLKQPVLLLTVLVLLGSCTVDSLGLVTSTDLDARLSACDTFNYLTPEDRALTLPDTYSFLVVSDTHIKGGNAFGLERLKDIVTASDKFAVITGDITQNGKREDVQKFIEIGNSLGILCYPVIGNHDIYFGDWSIWRELIGSTRYRVDSPSSTTSLFFLDTANAFFGVAQLDWLENELKTAKRHVFVFTHTNFFVDNMADLQAETDIRERARILSLLKGRVDTVFTGHIHKRMQKTIGGVQYVTLEDYRNKSTYCRVTVSSSGISYDFLEL